MRDAKIEEAQRRNGGQLRCEVLGCGFNFEEIYGELGEGFAHVHHLNPLGEREVPSDTTLDDLAIVCANCHAMIHRNGGNRDPRTLIKRPG